MKTLLRAHLCRSPALSLQQAQSVAIAVPEEEMLCVALCLGQVFGIFATFCAASNNIPNTQNLCRTVF